VEVRFGVERAMKGKDLSVVYKWLEEEGWR
jgi:hypothetical protein